MTPWLSKMGMKRSRQTPPPPLTPSLLRSPITPLQYWKTRGWISHIIDVQIARTQNSYQLNQNIVIGTHLAYCEMVYNIHCYTRMQHIIQNTRHSLLNSLYFSTHTRLSHHTALIDFNIDYQCLFILTILSLAFFFVFFFHTHLPPTEFTHEETQQYTEWRTNMTSKIQNLVCDTLYIFNIRLIQRIFSLSHIITVRSAAHKFFVTYQISKMLVLSITISFLLFQTMLS